MISSRPHPYPGRFITFEGIDGAGKSTHIDYVTTLLETKNRKVIVTREPGGTGLGEKLRELLLHENMHPETEALLMFAARKEHLEQVIEPAIKRGDWVISDRFTDASFAYQGGGRGLERDKLRQLEHWVHPHLQPDMTFLFDVSPEIAQARLKDARSPDKFEREKAGFLQSCPHRISPPCRRISRPVQNHRQFAFHRIIRDIWKELIGNLAETGPCIKVYFQ